MKIRWQMQFVSLRGTSYVVNIYDANYNGNYINQLTGGANPFVTEEDDDEDFYVPIRTQSGKLGIIVNDLSMLRALMPTKATDRPVVLRTSTNVVKWVGYIPGSQYSQPWDAPPFETSIPVVGIMEAMKGEMFTQANGFTSLYDIMSAINDKFPIGLRMFYPNIARPNEVYAQNLNFQKFIEPIKRADLDTTDSYEPSSLFDVVEAWCQYLGVSLREFGNAFYFTVHDYLEFASYEEDDFTQSTQAQYGDISFNNLTIGSNDHKMSYAKAYKRVEGTFSVDPEKYEEIFNLENVWKQFKVRAYPTNPGTAYALFDGNVEVKPYLENTQRVSPPITVNGDYSGGQICYFNFRQLGGFWISSLGSTAQVAMTIQPERKVYKVGTGRMFVRIKLSVKDGAAWNMAGATGNIYIKMQVGNLWLNSSGGSGTTRVGYSWSSTNAPVLIPIKDGDLDEDRIAESNGLRLNNGIEIPLPTTMQPGVYSVYFEFIDNYSGSITRALVSDFAIGSGLMPDNSLSANLVELKNNVIAKNISNDYADVYSLECPLTTAQSPQNGAGVVVDEDSLPVTTRYDQVGINRRAALMNMPREMLNIGIVNYDIQPIDHVTMESGQQDIDEYAVVSQRTDWRNDLTHINLIYLDTTQI